MAMPTSIDRSAMIKDDFVDDGVVTEESDDDMFDMFTGEVTDTSKPAQDNQYGDVRLEDDEWDDLTSIDDPKEAIDDEETPGAWIALPPDEKPPATVDELRAINTDANEPFDYAEVPCPDENTIRIIDILPDGTNDHSLSLTTRTATVSGPNKDHFIAITHAEECSSNLVEVPCNGKLLSVPSGIFAALVNIGRNLDNGVWSVFGRRPCVWIDAVCLEHDDDRLWRIRQMPEIFRSAERVIIWLGHPPYFSTHEDGVALCDQELAALHLNEASGPQVTDLVLSRDELAKTLRSTWFRSRASVHPFAAAKRRTVLLPDGKPVELVVFQQMLQDYGLEDLSGPVRDIRLFANLWPQRPLITNLHHYADLDWETPHDIVYALLGISCVCDNKLSTTRCGIKNCGLRGVQISYEQPIYRLFTEVAQRALAADPVAVLTSAAIRQHGTEQSWPSWVPDWRIAPKYTSSRSRKCIDESFGIDFGRLLWIHGFSMPDMDLWQCHDRLQPKTSDQQSLAIRLEHGTPTIIGWLMQHPPSKTKVRDLSWDGEDTMLSGMRTPSWARGFDRGQRGSFLKPTEKYLKTLEKMSEHERRYQTVSAEWPRLSADDVVIFMLGSRMSFVVRPADEGKFRLVDCIVRPATLTNTRFAWLDDDTGDVWAYGDCTQAPAELSLT